MLGMMVPNKCGGCQGATPTGAHTTRNRAGDDELICTHLVPSGPCRACGGIELTSVSQGVGTLYGINAACTVEVFGHRCNNAVCVLFDKVQFDSQQFGQLFFLTSFFRYSITRELRMRSSTIQTPPSCVMRSCESIPGLWQRQSCRFQLIGESWLLGMLKQELTPGYQDP